MPKKALLGRLSDTDIRLLQIFRTVVECAGFTAAELELNINRSTISRHMKDLETRLGVILCLRGRAGFTLTPEGEMIFQTAQKLFDALEEFRIDVGKVHNHMQGELTIALFDKTVTNNACKVSNAIKLMHINAPDVAINVHVGAINVIEQKVLEKSFDVGIVPHHRSSPSLYYQHLFDEKMFLYVSREHPLWDEAEMASEEKVRACEYVGLGFHSANMDAARRLQLVRAASAFDQEAVATLILTGRYIGFLPDHYAASFVAQRLLKPLRPDSFNYDCRFSAITPVSAKPSRILTHFLECLRDSHKI